MACLQALWTRTTEAARLLLNRSIVKKELASLLLSRSIGRNELARVGTSLVASTIPMTIPMQRFVCPRNWSTS